VIPSEPLAPDLAAQLPHSLRLDAKAAGYYREACDAYEVGDQDEDDVMASYGLSRSAACNWAADCYTIQGGLTFEYIQIQQADYAERLRAWGRELQSLIKKIEVMDEKENQTTERFN
tara:strand:- start:2753 stop:3103 length:351 start_codon:yes stop_codon:yes gene_type:complete